MEQSDGIKSDNSYIADKKTPLQKVGEFLREARKSRNLSIEDLASSLRIGKEQLIALEEGDDKSLPEKVFIRAMVRRIAEKLHLDTNFILDELNKKETKAAKPNPLIKKKNVTKTRGFNPFGMVILSGLLGLIASTFLVKYINSVQNNSINPQQSNITSLEKNIYY